MAAPDPSAPIASLRLGPGWRIAFAIDALLSIIAGALWMFDGAHFVRSTFGVAHPDGAHLQLALKGGIPLTLLAGVFYLGLLRGPNVPRATFAWFQVCLAVMDVVLLWLGVGMLHASSGGEPTTAATAQVIVSALRLALRVGFRFGPLARG